MFKTKGKINEETALIFVFSTRNYLRLRLEVALLALKLARLPAFEELVTQDAYLALAMTAQTPSLEARSRFLCTLAKNLASFRLHVRYWTIMMLTALEPDVALKEKVCNYCIMMAHSERLLMFVRVWWRHFVRHRHSSLNQHCRD
jgi:hypothetical protein